MYLERVPQRLSLLSIVFWEDHKNLKWLRLFGFPRPDFDLGLNRPQKRKNETSSEPQEKETFNLVKNTYSGGQIWKRNWISIRVSGFRSTWGKDRDWWPCNSSLQAGTKKSSVHLLGPVALVAPPWHLLAPSAFPTPSRHPTHDYCTPFALWSCPLLFLWLPLQSFLRGRWWVLQHCGTDKSKGHISQGWRGQPRLRNTTKAIPTLYPHKIKP